MSLLLVGRMAAFVLGALLVIRTLAAAIRTFVVPRAQSDRLTGAIFLASRRLFDSVASRYTEYRARDAVLALYAPVTLVALPAAYLVFVGLGYTAMFWGARPHTIYEAALLSGSSLLTLGFAPISGPIETLLSFSEATIGLILITVLIAYLPTMYSAFSGREKVVTMLEVRAGSPPSAVTMWLRYARLNRLDVLDTEWQYWEEWFVELEESHTSLAALVFFRSPVPERSWVNAAGVVLDAAALRLSTVDRPFEVQAAMTLRAGYIALRKVADFFRITYARDPRPDDPISIPRAEYDAVLDVLEQAGVPLRADREQCWRDFRGWRVNYDTVLLRLKAITVAPEAPWDTIDVFPARGPDD
jgi:hypothetical protein